MNKILLSILTSIPVFVLALANSVGFSPEPIKVHSLTPTEISEQFQREQKQENYDNAEEMAAHVLKHNGCDDEFAELIGHTAVDEGVSPRVVAAVVVIESSARPHVVSTEGAVGLMQVLPKAWHRYPQELKNPTINVKVGTHILASLIHHYGLHEGLHHYNGMGVGCSTCDGEYSMKVLKAAGYRV